MDVDDSKSPHVGRTRATLMKLPVAPKLAQQHRRRYNLQQSRPEPSPVQLPPVEAPSARSLRELFEAAAGEVRDVDRRVMDRCCGFQLVLLYQRRYS